MSASNADEDDTDYSEDEVQDEDDGQDDEATLDEEERFQNEAEIADELAALHQEQDLPLEDLIKMYGCDRNDLDDSVPFSSSENNENNGLEASSSSNNSKSAAHTASNLHNSPSYSSSSENLHANLNDDDEKVKLYFCGSDDGSDNGDDNYEPNCGFWKKVIRVGSDYQARIPPESINSNVSNSISSSYSSTSSTSSLPSEVSRDSNSGPPDLSELVWTPPPSLDTTPVDQNNLVENYLKQIYCTNAATSEENDQIEVKRVKLDKELPDNESALKFFFENNYDLSKASKFKLESDKKESSWSKEEIDMFEKSIKEFGKNFHLIKQRLANKSVSDVVNFYYYWKKSEMYTRFAKLVEIEYNQYLKLLSLSDKNDVNLAQDQGSSADYLNSIPYSPTNNTFGNVPEAQLPVPLNGVGQCTPLKPPPITYRVINRGNNNLKIKWINNRNRIYSYGYSPSSANNLGYSPFRANKGNNNVTDINNSNNLPENCQHGVNMDHFSKRINFYQTPHDIPDYRNSTMIFENRCLTQEDEHNLLPDDLDYQFYASNSTEILPNSVE